MSLGGIFGGDGTKGDGLLSLGQGGGGAGMGGAIFMRNGTLTMSSCQFVDNHAEPGQGAPITPALGKGGAIFIYQHELFVQGPSFDLAMLRAQSFSLNTCTNLPNDPDIDPTYDNADYYVPVLPWLADRLGPAALRPLRLLERRLGWPFGRIP
jgi:hypothetical protein